jgi:hypothetical protein
MAHFVSIKREMGEETVDHVDCPLKVIHNDLWGNFEPATLHWNSAT